MKKHKKTTAEEITQGVDLSGKTILITGANSGLGLESLRVLSLRGAHVIAAARTLEKAEQACATVNGPCTPLACELSDLDNVRTAADTVLGLQQPLDVLLCNAGIMALPDAQQAHDLEMQFLTNHVGHFLLIQKLLPRLEQAEQGRVVIVSSEGHQHTVKGGIDFDNLSGEKAYDGWRFYGQSKLANVLTAKALKKHLEGTAVTANALHPGVIRTNLGRNATGIMSKVIGLFAPLMEKTVGQGAATQVYLAAHPEAANYNGEYFSDIKPKSPSRYAQDTELENRLWQISQEIIQPYV